MVDTKTPNPSVQNTISLTWDQVENLFNSLPSLLFLCESVHDFRYYYAKNYYVSALTGVEPGLVGHYANRKEFQCLDGHQQFPIDFVNDDYCDCDDGSDEPGTSACSNGRCDYLD